MRIRRYIPLFIFFTLDHFCFGQTRVMDSLKLNIMHTAGNSERLSLIFELSEQSISADSLLPFVFSWFGFRNYRRRQQLKMQIALEEEKRHAADAVKQAEEKERIRIAADLHDNLGSYTAAIIANIDDITENKN